MKRVMFLPLLLVVMCGSTRADVAAQLLEQLKSELKAEARAARDKGDRADTQQSYQIQQMLMQLQRSNLEEETGTTLLQTIESVGTMTLSEKVEQICTALATELRKEQKDKELAAIVEMEETMAESLRATLKAKTAKDVDEPLSALGRLTQQGRQSQRRTPKLQALQNQAQQAWEFVRQWQDLLAATAAGNTSEARQHLQNLKNSSANVLAAVPRSELLERLSTFQEEAGPLENQTISAADQEARARKILDETKSLDQLGELIRKLSVIPSATRDFNSINRANLQQLLSTLRSFQKTYDELNRGMASRINLSNLNSRSPFDDESLIEPLRSKLVSFALPRVLGVKEQEGPKPDENVATYLQRVIAKAQMEKNWEMLGRVIEVAQTLNISAVTSPSDATALREFMSGWNQERARQFALAVSSYQAALKTGSQIVSPEFIGERLEAMRKADPEQFERGMQLTVNPPPPPAPAAQPVDSRFGPRPAGMPSHMPWPPGFAGPPGRPNAATPEESKVLTVPATPAKVEPAPASPQTPPVEAPKRSEQAAPAGPAPAQPPGE